MKDNATKECVRRVIVDHRFLKNLIYVGKAEGLKRRLYSELGDTLEVWNREGFLL